MSWITDLFKKIAAPMPTSLGANVDTRTEDERKDDIKFSDIVGTAAAVDWQPKTLWRKFPELDQLQSMMCGAFSVRKYLGVYYKQKLGDWLDFSEEDIYQRRANRPYAGMEIHDIFRILKEGVTLKALTGVQVRTDADADGAKIQQWKRDIGAKFFALEGEPVYIPGGDIETIASVIQTTGKSVILMMFFTAAEWSAYMPAVQDQALRVDSDRALRHFVVATDFGVVNGRKALKIDDSAHFAGLSERLLTEDFLRARNVIAAYGMSFKFERAEFLPSYTGTIMSFQECMRSIGLFPTNVGLIESFGPITRKACMDFQFKQGVPQTGTITPATEQRLRSMFP